MPLYPYLPNRFLYSIKEVVYGKFVNFKFMIYNGKLWSTRLINEYMIGYKFGSFVITRKKMIFKKNHKKKIKK